jgi:hypothetical protein
MTTRCQPGELCIIIVSGVENLDWMLRPAVGLPVTVTSLCPAAAQFAGPGAHSWHYEPPIAVPCPWIPGVNAHIHSIPDVCLKPIRPGAPDVSAEKPRELESA